ncbi:MAG: site-specific integrase [Acidobacteria bacterium]|nr:site-specific integrase [Acidobacteriota bacterium]
MGVERVKDGVYRIRWWEGGRYRCKTLKGVTLKAANGFLRRKLTKKNHIAAGIAEPRKWTFEELAGEWFATYAAPRLAAETVRVARILFKAHLKLALGPQEVSSLKRVDLERYRTKRLGTGAKNSTVNREVSLVLRIVAWAVDAELLETSPFQRRLKPLPETQREIFFTPDEWSRFVRAFDDAKAWEEGIRKARHLFPVVIDPGKGTVRRYGGSILPDSEASHAMRERHRAAIDVFRALLLSGCRVSEVLSLTWSQVDLENRVVRFRQRKTGTHKAEPMSAELEDLLRRQRRGIGSAPVFVNPLTKRAWDYARIRRIFERALALAGLREELTIHALRHTFVSWLTVRKEPERHIQELAGHKTPGMTRRYAHMADPEHLRETANVIGRLVREAEGERDQKRPPANEKLTRRRKS